MTRDDATHLRNAVEHLERLQAHLGRGDLDDDTVFDAVCMRLSAAIESVAAITPRLRDEHWGEDWPAIWGVRNRIAHGYFWIDRTIVTATVRNDLPELEYLIHDLLVRIEGRSDARESDGVA